MRITLPRAQVPLTLPLDGAVALSARAGFVLLFPGYFAYHYAISRGWIPAFAGGLFGITTLGLAAVAAAAAPWIVGTQVQRGGGLAIAIGALLALVLSWSTVQLLLAPTSTAVLAGWTEAMRTVVAWTAMLFVGRFLPFEDVDAARRGRWWFALVTLGVAHAIISSGSLLGGFLAFAEFEGDAVQSSYQGIGRSILVTAIVVMAQLKGDGARLLVLGLGVLLLASIGSRSELAALVALFGLVGMLAIVTRRRVTLFFGLAIIGVALAAILAPVIAESRIGELLDLASSSSWQARQELTRLATERIGRSPLLGDFEYYQRDIGSGGYSHNILSAWTNYTVLGIALYAGVTLVCLMSAVRRVASWETASAAWIASFAFNAVTVVLIVSAIPVSHALPALGWGITLRALSGEAPPRLREGQ